MDSESFRKNARKSYPKLWQENDDIHTNRPSSKMPTHIQPESEESFQWARSVPNVDLPSSGLEFVQKTNHDPFLIRLQGILSRSLVVAHQFSLCTLFLTAHRCVVCRSDNNEYEEYCEQCFDDDRVLIAIHIFTFVLVVISISTMMARRQTKELQTQRKRDRLHNRSVDAILIAGILRLLSSVLRTLTASYSSDTITALSVLGMICSFATADYTYLNGILVMDENEKSHHHLSTIYTQKQRPSYLGGTISINSVVFSAALLSSRLSSETTAYIFFMWTVILFAYYPEARFLVNQTSFGTVVTFVSMLGTSTSAMFILNKGFETNIFVVVQVSILIVAPIYKAILLKKKRKIFGPWDIAHIKVKQ